MLPKSNKRAKYPSAETSALNERTATESTRAFSNNKASKALELPLELLMEILSYFECLPVPTTSRSYITLHGVDYVLPSRYLERTDALRSLSQTCKLWRNIFFPLLWERLEACLSHSSSNAWYKVYGDALIRKSTLVCENPEIASHVRSMTVSLSRYSLETVLLAYVRAVEALPNLHTLQVIRTHHKMTTALKKAFAGHLFPQVQTVALPGRAHNILRSCPQVRKVICIGYEVKILVSTIARFCKKVEEVEGFDGSVLDMERLVKAAPNLRSIKFHYLASSSHLQPFSTLKKLAHVTLYSHRELEVYAMANTELLACIDLAKQIVRKAEGRRSVTVEHYSWSRNFKRLQEWSRTFDV